LCICQYKGIGRREKHNTIDVTGARALSGYGTAVDTVSSIHLDKAFICRTEDNVIKSFEKNKLCNSFDFRLLLKGGLSGGRELKKE
jgi:hypothetical protein